MASPNLINAVAKQLLLPGNIAAAKKFFAKCFDDAPDSDSKRGYGRLLDSIDEYETKSAAKAAKPTTDIAAAPETGTRTPQKTR